MMVIVTEKIQVYFQKKLCTVAGAGNYLNLTADKFSSFFHVQEPETASCLFT